MGSSDHHMVNFFNAHHEKLPMTDDTPLTRNVPCFNIMYCQRMKN